MNNNDSIFIEFEKLVARFKSGDESAYEEIYKKSERLVYTVCYGILNNEEDAFDAMQETYLTVYKKIESLEDDKAFVSWLKRIATMKALDAYRKKKGDVSYDDAVAADESLQLDDDLESLPDSYIMEKAKRDALDKIIKDELTDVQYQTIHMHYYSEMSVEQIAEIMGCPVGTVKTRLKSSRAKIKEGIKKYEKDNKDAFAGIPAVPFLTRFFNVTSENLKVPMVDISTLVGDGALKAAKTTVAKATVKTVAGTAAKETVKTGFLASTTGKIVVAVLIVAALGTTSIVTKAIYDNKNQVIEPNEEAIETTNEAQLETSYTDMNEAVTDVAGVADLDSESSDPTEETNLTDTVYEFDRENVVVCNDQIEIAANSVVYTWSVPQIDIDSPDAQAINDEIRNTITQWSQDLDGFYLFEGEQTEYAVFWPNESVFSLVITNASSWEGGHIAYTFNPSSGVRLTSDDILEIAGLDEALFTEIAVNAATSDLNDELYAWGNANAPIVVDGELNDEWVVNYTANNPGMSEAENRDVFGNYVADSMNSISLSMPMFLNSNGEIVIWRSSLQEPEHMLNIMTNERFLRLIDI